MGIKNKLKEIGQTLMAMAFEPDRVQGLVQHFQEIGVDASMEWMPSTVKPQAMSGTRMCIGRIKIAGSPIDLVELHKTQTGQRVQTGFRVRQTIMYEYHYIINIAGQMPVMAARARRVPRRRFKIFGPILGYFWKGADLAQTLEGELALSERLDQAKAGRLWISHDRKSGWLRIVQRFVGMTTDTNVSLTRLATGNSYADIQKRGEYPSRERFDAIAYLAERLRYHLT